MASNRRLITYNSKTMTIAQWSVRTGLSQSVIAYRLKAGWSPHRVFNAPLDPRGRKPEQRGRFASEFPSLTALQRDMHAQHRALQRSIRAFIGDIESQMAELRRNLDCMIEEQIDSQLKHAVEGMPGVVANFAESAPDRSLPVAQDSI